MKLILIFLLTVVLITKGYQLAPYQTTYCSELLFHYDLQSTVVDLDESTDVDFKTCILKNIHSKQSLVLIGGSHTYRNPLLHLNRITEHPNILIITKNIMASMLDLPSVKRVLKAHRSLVYISVMDNERFKCTDGFMNTTDFVSLETFMNQLWHRFKVSRVGVLFPYMCKDKIAIYSGKRRTDQLLYDRTIQIIDLTENIYKDLSQSGQLLTEYYPLKANIFQRFPTSVTECGKLHYYTKINLNLTEGYCGLDALVMHDIVKHFKFNLHFPKDDDCYRYGYASANNVSGSLGCIVRKKLDISFNSRFMTMYSKDYVYFLHYVTTSSLCALVRRADAIPIWLYAVSVYRGELWLLITSLIVAIGILKWAVAKIKYKITDNKPEIFYFYIEDAFASIMFGFSMKKKGKLYLLRGICLCSSILFAATYQGHVNYVFTTLQRYETIKTLDGLYSDKTLYTTTSMKQIMKQLHNPENKLQHAFLMRSRPISENYTLDWLLKHPRTTLLGRKNDAIIEILSQYTDKDNIPLINIVDQCFYTYYLSYITRSGFPFYEEMQRFMQRVGEAGLPMIYHKWMCDMLGVPHTLPKIRKEPRPFAKINLQNQRIPFGILITGYVVSLIAFVVEIVKGRRRSRVGARK